MLRLQVSLLRRIQGLGTRLLGSITRHEEQKDQDGFMSSLTGIEYVVPVYHRSGGQVVGECQLDHRESEKCRDQCLDVDG